MGKWLPRCGNSPVLKPTKSPNGIVVKGLLWARLLFATIFLRNDVQIKIVKYGVYNGYVDRVLLLGN